MAANWKERVKGWDREKTFVGLAISQRKRPLDRQPYLYSTDIRSLFIIRKESEIPGSICHQAFNIRSNIQFQKVLVTERCDI